MKLRLKSDGTVKGSMVLTEQGDMIEGVRMVTVFIDASNDLAVMQLSLDPGKIDVEIDGENVSVFEGEMGPPTEERTDKLDRREDDGE